MRHPLAADRQLTPDDCLRYALNDERVAKECGPHDPAFELLMRESRYWLDVACRLERLSN
jgi:hypothetical protein